MMAAATQRGTESRRRAGSIHECAACVMRAAEIIGRELGWSASQRFDAVREFVQSSWLGRAPVLTQAGWAQEELVQGATRGLFV